MKDLLQKIKPFYVKVVKKEETYGRHGIKPTRDWSVLLIINFVVFVMLVMFTFYFYIQIKNDKLFVANETNTLKEVTINTNLLNKTIDDIKAREEVTNNLKNNKVSSPDPSLSCGGHG
jgi:hypothetical protein